jgi:hypothetical protein
MALYNKDGTVYKLTGELSQLIPDSPSHDLFNLWDQEAIRAGGTPLLYYEVFISNIDKLYLESRDKLWSQHPVEIWGVYDPIPSQFEQGLFGIDGPDTMVFSTNYQDTLDKLGHLPVIGSRIFTPHLKEHWEIIDRKLGDFHRWKVYRVEIHCQRFQESLTTGEGRVTNDTDPNPSFEID